MRVKWRTTSTSESSGTPSRSSSRLSSAGSSSSNGVSSTSSAGSMKPTLPGCERSKTSASFCVMCGAALVMSCELIVRLGRGGSCDVCKPVHERVDLGARVRLGDADEEVVRAFVRVAREREAAGDVPFGGEAAQQGARVRRRAHDELVEDGRRVGEGKAFERG